MSPWNWKFLELKMLCSWHCIYLLVKRWSLESQKMPVTISNQRLGPVGQLRDVFHPWRQNGSVAMGACPERFTHFLQVPPPLLAGQATDNSLPLHSVYGRLVP